MLTGLKQFTALAFPLRTQFYKE